jgi:hypothetical protein
MSPGRRPSSRQLMAAKKAVEEKNPNRLYMSINSARCAPYRVPFKYFLFTSIKSPVIKNTKIQNNTEIMPRAKFAPETLLSPDKNNSNWSTILPKKFITTKLR